MLTILLIILILLIVVGAFHNGYAFSTDWIWTILIVLLLVFLLYHILGVG